MRMCAASAKLPPWGTVYCTKSKGHHGDHHAYDALIDHMWTDEIDELADRRNRGAIFPDRKKG
jgi:hypothetical protein